MVRALTRHVPPGPALDHARKLPSGQWNPAAGMYYSTYKATMRRNGVYDSATAGAIDMNEASQAPLPLCPLRHHPPGSRL